MTAKSIVRLGYLIWMLCCIIPTEAANRSVTSKEAQHFARTKTYFVITGDDVVADSYLKEAMNNIWKITPCEIINRSRFEQLKNDTLCSFVLINPITHTKYPNKHYLYLNLLLGSSTANNIGELPEIAAIPFGCVNSDKDPKYYLMSSLLQFLQQHATRIQTKSFWEYFKLDFDKRLGYYNRFNSELKGKNIYIDTADLDKGISTEYLLLTFGKRVIRTNEKALEKLSKQNADSNLIAFSIPSFNIIIAPASGNILYINGKPGRDSDRFKMEDMKILFFNIRERKNFLTY